MSGYPDPQPIETAPRDGTRILGWYPTRNRRYPSKWVIVKALLYPDGSVQPGWMNTDNGKWYRGKHTITMWMPLPPDVKP